VADLRWIDGPEPMDSPDLLILPGSRHVAADLAWLVRAGLAAAACEHAREGRRLLGICGGLQMLGESIEDPAGVDGSAHGLGLLPIRTTFNAVKRTERTSARFRPLPEPWAVLGDREVTGYEIRHGATETTAAVTEALPGLAMSPGRSLASTCTGCSSNPTWLRH
jgi:adenosylcobyric acid synthase